MHIPAFFPTFITAIISVATLANALPTVGKLPATEPRSLLGRQYRDVRVRQPLAVDLQPRQFNDLVFERAAESLTRSERFHAIQRKRAQIHVRDEHLVDHSENLLSNQSPGSPLAVQTPIPIPSPTLPNTYTPVALESDPTQSARRRAKHSSSKSKKKGVYGLKA